MLIISTIKEVPIGKSLAIARTIYLIPGMICSAILAGSGVNIKMVTVTTANTIKDLNTSNVWTETTTQSSNFVLQSPIWLTVHYLIFAVLLTYLITQILILFTRHEKEAK